MSFDWMWMYIITVALWKNTTYLHMDSHWVTYLSINLNQSTRIHDNNKNQSRTDIFVKFVKSNMSGYFQPLCIRHDGCI